MLQSAAYSWSGGSHVVAICLGIARLANGSWLDLASARMAGAKSGGRVFWNVPRALAAVNMDIVSSVSDEEGRRVNTEDDSSIVGESWNLIATMFVRSPAPEISDPPA